MVKSYLKIALRSLIRHKAFSLINISGFAFSIAIFIMITLFVIKEYSFDRYNDNADCVYRLVDSENNSSGIDYRLEKKLVDNFPEIKSGCVVNFGTSHIEISYNHNKYTFDDIRLTDNNFFKVFSIPILSGNTLNPLQNPNSVVLTESSANKIFGNENPIGKTFLLLKTGPMIVTAVIKDFPDNSSISAGMLLSADNNKFNNIFSCTNNQDSSTFRYPKSIYLLLSKNANANTFLQNINKHTEILYPYVKKVSLLPLKDIYLHDNTLLSDTKKGNPALLELMTGIALIILVLAIVNYVNLTVAQQNRRNKETGIRKTIGAGRKDIIVSFLTESVLVTFAAFAFALLIVEISLPDFGRIMNSSLSIKALVEFPVNLILLLSIFSIGIVSGLGPALILSSFNPVSIFSGSTIILGRKSYIKNILTVFQFMVSIALIFCIIIIQKQINYVKHSDLGFDKEQLLRLDVPCAKAPVLINKLKQNTYVKDVSGSLGVPGEINITMSPRIEGKDRYLRCILADSMFLKTMKIQLLTGRELLPGEYGNVCLINETAYKYFHWKDLNNKKFMRGTEFRIIGVVKDFHFSSFHNVIEPFCIIFASSLSLGPFVPQATFDRISLRIKAGTVGETMKYIGKVWKEVIPDQNMNFQFYDEVFNQMYFKEEKFAKAIGLFTILAISISCMGILGLVIFASERRSKEIGIRKVHGAKVSELMFMLNKDFLKWVILASVIALPLGWYAMNKWLQDFAYRTEINWWVFALAGLAAVVIALLTVSWHTWRAVRKNPIEVLRYE